VNYLSKKTFKPIFSIISYIVCIVIISAGNLHALPTQQEVTQATHHILSSNNPVFIPIKKILYTLGDSTNTLIYLCTGKYILDDEFTQEATLPLIRPTQESLTTPPAFTSLSPHPRLPHINTTVTALADTTQQLNQTLHEVITHSNNIPTPEDHQALLTLKKITRYGSYTAIAGLGCASLYWLHESKPLDTLQEAIAVTRFSLETPYPQTRFIAGGLEIPIALSALGNGFSSLSGLIKPIAGLIAAAYGYWKVKHWFQDPVKEELGRQVEEFEDEVQEELEKHNKQVDNNVKKLLRDTQRETNQLRENIHKLYLDVDSEQDSIKKALASALIEHEHLRSCFSIFEKNHQETMRISLIDRAVQAELKTRMTHVENRLDALSDKDVPYADKHTKKGKSRAIAPAQDL